MYSYEEWSRESEAVKSRLNFFNREHDAFWREYMRDRAEVQPDEKLGRISIPKRLLDVIGVEKEVVFAGNDHKIEIWAKEQFAFNKMKGDDFTALAEKILG
jgi:MraZ protein